MFKVWRICVFILFIAVSCSESKKSAESASEKKKTTENEQVENKAIEAQKGLKLIKGSDCIACHMDNQKLVGPSYKEVAEKYKNEENAKEQLVKNIIEGASGVWDDVAMPAHPQLSKEDVSQMVDYIL
ncbi:MAG: c-type cytochrome, partial [Bacteroidota bacterium]